MISMQPQTDNSARCVSLLLLSLFDDTLDAGNDALSMIFRVWEKIIFLMFYWKQNFTFASMLRWIKFYSRIFHWYLREQEITVQIFCRIFNFVSKSVSSKLWAINSEKNAMKRKIRKVTGNVILQLISLYSFASRYCLQNMSCSGMVLAPPSCCSSFSIFPLLAY